MYQESGGGQIAMPAMADQLCEYACREGDYRFQAVLSGARYEEREGAPGKRLRHKGRSSGMTTQRTTDASARAALLLLALMGLQACGKNDIPCLQKNFSLFDVYGADEAFLTGTFGALTPVKAVDGRTIGEGVFGPMTSRLEALYQDEIRAAVTAAQS